MKDDRGKVLIFAVRMKKFSHILLSMLLSMTLLFVGSGVTITRCAHTGQLKVVTVFNSGGMDGMSCNMNASCMHNGFHKKRTPADNPAGVLFTFLLFYLFTFLPLKRSIPHATRGGECRDERRECGYYHLHRNLNDSLLTHTL